MTISLSPTLRTRVRTAVTFGTWTDRPEIEPLQDSDGAGQVVGDASFRRFHGQVAQPRAAIATVATLDLSGQWVQILHEDPLGSITVDGDTWTAAWHGRIQGHRRAENGGDRGETIYHAIGIAGTFGQITMTAGVELYAGSVPVPVDPGYLPPFNRMAGGDRTAATYTVGSDVVYIHDRQSHGNRWTARQILDHLLALYSRPLLPPLYAGDGTITWTVSDPGACLAYEPEDLDLHGASLLDAINALANARRGLTWWTEITGTAGVVVVASASPVAVSSGYTYTLPASTTTATPDLTGVATTGVLLQEDASACADVI
jgi:hypothetical protein